MSPRSSSGPAPSPEDAVASVWEGPYRSDYDSMPGEIDHAWFRYAVLVGALPRQQTDIDDPEVEADRQAFGHLLSTRPTAGDLVIREREGAAMVSLITGYPPPFCAEWLRGPMGETFLAVFRRRFPDLDLVIEP